MKGVKSKLALAFVCLILGFLLTNKFRALSAKNNSTPESETEKNRIKSEIEAINQENQKLEKENSDLIDNIKKYEAKAAKEGNIDPATKTQLDTDRMLLGTSEDSKGQGVIFSINPKSNIFSNYTGNSIENRELVYFVNELIVAGAEAISINDKRITSQTGIRSSSGNSYILINEEKISPSRKITIKAIGDKKKLQDSVSKVDIVKYPKLTYYELKVEASNSVTISRYNKKYQMDYIKPVNTKK
jgi:uncharacterized protein YlxW (UPF0749 family)